MGSLFFYGTLRYVPLLDVVLGRGADLRTRTARLPGYAVHWAADESFPMIVEARDAVTDGVLVEGLGPQDYARLDFYEGGFAYDRVGVSVETDGAPVETTVFVPQPGRWEVGPPWSLADWEAQWGAITLRAATEVMASYGHVDASEVARWFPQVRVRAASWVQAQSGTMPMQIRRGLTAADVTVKAARRPYSKFFTVDEQDLTFRLFDGGQSEVVTRAAFVSGDAVTVLPYDPVRDRVLIIEQFRFGPLVRGDRHPWSLEPIAGRIDPGETAEATAHREAREEAGLTLTSLEFIARYYPSPGAVTEYLSSYVGIADLTDDAARIGGEASEAEDIRGIVLSFDALMDLLGPGEAENGPLILSAYWLAANRARLRRGA